MAYPLINQGVINGALARADTGMRVQSLQPVRFGTPGIPVRVQSLRPVQFGTPRLKGQEMYPESLAPVRFGTPEVQFGMLPGGMTMQAQSLRPVALGRPSLQAVLHVGPAPSLTPARFGQAWLAERLGVQSLHPVSFGTPALTMAAQVGSLHPVRWGGPTLQMGFHGGGLRAGRCGTPRLQLAGLSFTPESLQPVNCGSPALGGMAMRVRTLCPAYFGRPTLDRGAAC